MNNKHIAVILIGLLAFGFLQGILWVRGERDKTIAKAEALQAEEATQRQLVAVQTAQLAQLKQSSTDLISFLNAWEGPLSRVRTPENAEALFITKIRDGNLSSLSQKFGRVALKAGSSLSGAVRAQLTFEDDYASLLNWLGRLESELPTLRVNSVKISKGTRPQDIRMEATLDQPLYTP